MSSVVKEWLVVLIFFLTFIGLTIFEAFLINRKGWAGFGKSLAFSAATNFLAFAVGHFTLFVVLAAILAMAWDGSLERFPLQDYGIGAMLVGGVLFLPIFLMLCKRLFLKIFSLQSGKAAWLFAFVSSISIFLIAHGLPVLAGYVLFYFL